MHYTKTDSSKVQLMCKLLPIRFTSSIIMLFNLMTILMKIDTNLCEVQHLANFDYQADGLNNEENSMKLMQLSILADEESEPAIYVVAEEQGKAVLPCNISRPLNDSIDLILWFRGNAETAVYSLDARKANGIQRAKHLVSDDLSSRAYIDITGKPTALVVESVKASDIGEYKCRIDFRKGPTQYRTVHLDVIVPPKEVIIMDEYGQRLRDPVGPYNEGAHLTVICEAEGGKPRPYIRWLKDNQPLDESWIVTPQGIIRNELVITRLLRTDHKSILTCLASNSNLTKPVTASITLELNLRPLDVKITTVHRPLLADRKIEVSCESGGSRPPALVTWWKGSKRLAHISEEISKDENMTISTVYFTPTVEDNGKILSCRADHSILPDSALEDSWILDVYYTPRLTVSLGASIHHDQVREGSNVSFECHVVANPPVSEIGWKFEQKSLTNNVNNVYMSDNTLVLTKVVRQNSGKYRCVAANAEGEGESEDINLKVLYAPVCKLGQRTVYGVAKREPIKVPCEVDADPSQVTFRWSFNNSFEVLAVKNFISAKTRSIATYAPRTKYGYGELYCWAKNRVGEQSEPCVFFVIPAGPPQPVRNCIVGNQSTDGLIVKCEQGEDGGLEQQFFLEIYQSDSGQLQSNWSSAKAPVFEVTGLPIDTSFVLVLFAANPKGRSNYVTLTGSSAKSLVSDDFSLGTLQFGLKPVIYILISVVGSLVIAATVIIIISKVKSIDQNKGSRHNSSSQGGGSDSKNSTSDDTNAENTRRLVQNGNISGVQMGTLYVKAFDVIDGIEGANVDVIPECWDQNLNRDKYEIIEQNSTSISSEPHVTIAYEQRRTPEGDAFVERIATDWITNGSSLQPNDYKKLNRYLIPPNNVSIVGEQTIVMTDDEAISSETPLMNGIYFTSFTSNTHNNGRTTLQHKTQNSPLTTPLSTPV